MTDRGQPDPVVPPSCPCPGVPGAEEAVTVMRWSRRTVVLTVVGVLAVVLVVAVGLGARSTSSGGSATSTVGGPVADYAAGGEAARAAAPADPAAASPGAPAQVTTSLDLGRSLVRTAQLSVEIDDPVAGAARVRSATAARGGNVAEEQSGDTSSRLTLRVPAASLDALIDDVARLSHVTSRSGQVVDATDQVVDLGARVASQQASVVRVRTLLGQARSIGDIVSIEAELSRREADLDSLTSRLAALRDQVALSTLTVDIAKPGVPVEPPVAAGGFLGGLASGWEGLRVVASGVGVAAGFLLPFAAVLAVLGGTAWLARRRFRAQRVPAPAGGSGSGPAGGA